MQVTPVYARNPPEQFCVSCPVYNGDAPCPTARGRVYSYQTISPRRNQHKTTISSGVTSCGAGQIPQEGVGGGGVEQRSQSSANALSNARMERECIISDGNGVESRGNGKAIKRNQDLRNRIPFAPSTPEGEVCAGRGPTDVPRTRSHYTDT